MSAQKQTWYYRNGIGNAKYAPDAMHSAACTTCHGGVDGTSDKAAAHAGMTAVPGSSACQGCHDDKILLANASMHTTLEGYQTILAARGFDFTPGTESRARYDAQCTRCHAAVSSSESACGQCHVAVPAVASTGAGQLIAGHRMNRTPDTANNCCACHGSRVRNEYFGENQALRTRNVTYQPQLATTEGFAAAGAALQPDVHFSAGLGCSACHPSSEMHGSGIAPAIDRYGIAGRVQCETCHASLVGSNAFHTAGHLEAVACQLCHAQPYKNCFGCHTQLSPTTGAYFTSNGTDPTWTARLTAYANGAPAWSSTTTYAASAVVTYAAVQYKSLQASNLNHPPDTSPTWWQLVPAPGPDALMTFRAGFNPKYGVDPGAKRYAVLRHPPVDADVFTYTEEGGQMPGLIPNLTALPTWKYASPHTILRNTAVTTDPDGAGPQTACGNCHSSRYSLFWLTDAQLDAQGWTSGAAFETDANAGVVVPAPPAPALP